LRAKASTQFWYSAVRWLNISLLSTATPGRASSAIGAWISAETGEP